MTERNDAAVPAVEAQELTYTYPDGTPALKGLSLSIAMGESVCLAGPNGAGKTTFMLVMTGLIRVANGQIRVEGGEPKGDRLPGLVFQDADDQLFCPTIFDDVAFGPRNRKCPKEETARRVEEALKATGLTGYGARSAHHLSGGEKKRAAIAAVLACQPRILALDEPWANLDARGSDAVTKIIRDFQGTRVIASQDLYRAAEVCERLVVIDGGTVVAQGPIEKMLGDKDLLDRHGLDFGRRCRFCPESSRQQPESGTS